MRSDIVPGATFPDYELPDHAGDLAAFHGWDRSEPGKLVAAGRVTSA